MTKIDDNKFYRFYMKYYRILVLYAIRLVSDLSIAEDIVQDAFSNIWERHLSFESELSARSYLYSTVHHLCLDTRKHQGVVAEFESQVSGDASLTTPDDEEMDKDEVLRRVLEMIDRMPVRQREVFLHLMEGKKAKEIAEMMNISENTVKMQKKRGIDLMRQKLDKNSFSLFVALI